MKPKSIEKGLKVIKEEVKTLSMSSGVYIMQDMDKNALYVGKAKNLKKRVSNYLLFDKHSNRIKRMISKTRIMEFVETSSEMEALILEANLIKSLNPYYNIIFKDDKTYPEISINIGHDFPKITKHRGKKESTNIYFGPFANIDSVNKTIDILQKIFQIRTCSDSYFKNRSRPCLEYQIKKCSAPCVAKISKDKYKKNVFQALDFLEGKSQKIQEKLKKEMLFFSDNLEFEKAQIVKNRISSLSTVLAQQNLSIKNLKDADVIAIYASGGFASIQVMFFRGFNAYGTRLYHQEYFNEDLKIVMSSFLTQFYLDKIVPPNIILNVRLANKDLLEMALSKKYKVKIRFPEKGDLKDSLGVVYNNAKSANERFLISRNNHQKSLKKLNEILNIKKPIKKIEVFDNSHIQGNFPVGAMIVVDKNGFDKKSYRKWNIKTVMKRKDSKGVAGDDFAMMKEVFFRRYSKLASIKNDSLSDFEKSSPDLIVIDGGKGQLTVSSEVLDALNLDHLPLICVTKSEKRNSGKEIFYVKEGDNNRKIDIDIKSELHFFMQRIRDEAHRFAITGHKAKRNKQINKSALDEIEGIGKKRKREILQHFGSIKTLESVGVNDIEKVKGISKKMAEIIYRNFHKN